MKLKFEVEIDTDNEKDGEMIIVLLEKIQELKDLLEGFTEYND